MELKSLIREARTQCGLTQAEVADLVDLDPQHISKIERGAALPPPDLLVNLYQKLVGKRGQEGKQPSWRWWLAWLESKATHEAKLSATKEIIQTEVSQLNDRLAQGRVIHRSSLPWSLANFPFPGPFTVVIGDRRESQPSTRGDLFAYSSSALDVQWLLELGLGPSVSIVSDKLFAVMSEDYLKRRFGETHLLVIGSPAVNLASRLINRGALFRFVIPQYVKDFEAKLRELDPRLANKTYLRVFWHVVNNEGHADREALLRASLVTDSPSPEPSTKERLTIADVDEVEVAVQELMRGQAVKWWMNAFRGQGIIDPADLVVRATFTRPDNDFALVSMAPQPFASETGGETRFVAIMAAGIHGPGTMRALQLLAEPQMFARHPFGCVLELKGIDPERHDWASRIAMADLEFETHPYSPSSLIENLTGASPLDNRRSLALESLTQQESEKCLEFAQSLVAVGAESPR
jgi:transcriptional regulator with XRE-family HTH domain